MQHILISTLALNMSERKILTTASDLLVNEGLDCIILDNPDMRGQIVIIDTENDPQHKLINKTREGQIKILFSTAFFSDKNIVSLAKPISVDTLKELIYKISSRLKSQVENIPTSITLSDNSKVTSASKRTFFDILLNTKSKNSLIKISCLKHPDLYVDGYNNTISSSAKNSEIDTILTNTLDNCSVKDIHRSEYMKHSKNLNIFSLDGKLWFSGITGSNGVILSGHDINKPFKLKAWPNFTRNAYRPEHLKIAAILARQSATVCELEVLTNISRNEIINFYNAAYSVDLIDAFENNNPIPTIKNQLTPVTQNILHRLAARLHLA